MRYNNARAHKRRLLFCLLAFSLLSTLPSTTQSLVAQSRLIGSSGTIAYYSQSLISVSSNNPIAPSVPFKIDGSNYHPNGTEYLDGEWNWYTITAGTHTVEMPSPWTNPNNQITYYFSTWDDGITDNPRTVELAAGSRTSFYAIYVTTPPPPPGKALLIIVAGSGGTTNPTPGTYTYDANVQVTLTATPQTDYRFSYWADDDGVQSTNNPMTFTTQADTIHRWTANFEYNGTMPWRPFSLNSIYNTKIPSNVAYRSDSSAMLQASAGSSLGVRAGDIWMTAVYHIYEDTLVDWRWLAGVYVPVPLQPDGSEVPFPGGPPWYNADGGTVILDFTTGKWYDLFQFTGTSASEVSVYENFISDTGYIANGVAVGGGSAGALAAGGYVRPEEIIAGVIPHMMELYVGNSRGDNVHVFPPAARSAGWMGYPSLPIGSRIQLNPNYDISYLSPVAQIFAKAMQDYGAFPKEQTGGMGWQIGTEWDGSVQYRTGLSWADLGVTTTLLSSIPLSEYRVLEYGQKDANGNWVSGDLYNAVQSLGQEPVSTFFLSQPTFSLQIYTKTIGNEDSKTYL